MSGAATLETADGVAVVTVDNPPVNALADEVLEALLAVGATIAADDDVRAVVLTGAGTKAFMAGADLAEFEKIAGDLEAVAVHADLTRRLLAAWEGLLQPVVAAVQASAVGGGLEVLLVCDLVVADPAARFGQPEVKLGLIPGAGGTQRLPRRIGMSAAKELLLLGSLIDAERARALGLVNRVSEPGQALEEAKALAAKLAALPAVAVQAAKRATAEPPGDLASGLDRERALFFETFASADFKEGASAFLAKRAPNFVHR